MLLAINRLHFLAIKMTPKMALMFEVYKERNQHLIDEWVKRYPDLYEMPPIYWNGAKFCWTWQNIGDRSIPIYIRMCESIMYARGAE